MNHKRLDKISKFLSLILRHKPSEIGITLDEHGWANVEELLTKMSNLDMETLEEIVATDEKNRYSFNEDKTLIRANQGHSIAVDVELEKKSPPQILYHGTAEKNVASINTEGIKRRSRLYVHLSADPSTALNVGKRHGGKPMTYIINSAEMEEDGYEFYQSVNGVWLTKEVPVEYLRGPFRAESLIKNVE